MNSENPKWVYQSLYNEFANNPKFEVQVLITVRDKLLKKKYEFLEYEKLARKNYYLKRCSKVILYENYKAAYNSLEKDFKADVKISKIANTNMDKAVRKKKEQKDFEIEKFIKVAQKRLNYEEEMLKEIENEMTAELQEDFEDDFYTES